MNVITSFPEEGNVLFFNNGSGGGHASTIKQLESQLQKERPNMGSKTVDVLNVALPLYVANFIHNVWNTSQKADQIESINSAHKYQWIPYYLLMPIHFIGTVIILIANNIDQVVSPQPLCIKPTMLAVRCVNFFRSIFSPNRAPIRVTMILTELPTKYTENYFYSLRGLSSADLRFFTLVTTAPLLDADQSEADFWAQHTGIPMENIRYEQFPLRSGFQTYMNIDKNDIHTLPIRFSSEEELAKICECASLDESSHAGDQMLEVDIDPNDELFFLMLGSQASVRSTKEYVQEIIKFAKETPSDSARNLFVFCGKNTGSDSLFNQAVQLILDEKSAEDFPPNLRIVPLPSQTDSEIAPALRRANYAIIKPGGLTAFETLAAEPDQVFISYKDEDAGEIDLETEQTPEHLGNRLITHEMGNGFYLQHKLGATFASSRNFSNVLSRRNSGLATAAAGA